MIEKEAVILLPRLIRDGIRENENNTNGLYFDPVRRENISLSLSLFSLVLTHALQKRFNFSKEFRLHNIYANARTQTRTIIKEETKTTQKKNGRKRFEIVLLLIRRRP